MEKKTDKYVSADIQNELLKVMGLQVLRDIATSLHSVEFYSIMVDETTDVSNKEQAVLCFRWVSDDLIAHEDFVGLYGIENTEAKTLVNMILDVLTRLNLSIKKLRGQCYDGATNFIMEGKKTSIKDILKYLRNISSAERALLSEICIIAKLILVMPSTNAVSERSFSALRRVKTYLRSTMKQTRLNHLMILHVHKDITDSLNLNDIGNEFVRCSEHRLSVFGHF